MSEELTPHQRAAATKRRRTIRAVVEAAQVLFDAHGWYGVTLDDIAREANVSAAAISYHLPTKRHIALAAYTPMLRPVVKEAESATSNQDATQALLRFVYGLAEVAVQYPVLAIALLPASRDVTELGDETRSVSEEAVLVGFDQLAEILGELLKTHWDSVSRDGYDLTEVGEHHLSGLLFGVLKHPERSGEDAASLILSQLL